MIPLRTPLILLHVTDDGATLDRPHAAPLHVKGHKGEAVSTVLSALAQSSDLPILILADTAAQDYKYDDLPPVTPLDKRRLARRRLAHHFPQKDLARLDLTGKRNVLFTALPTTSPAAKWRGSLAKVLYPVWGIVPAPLETVRLAMRLCPSAKQGWAIFIFQLATGGFRQIITYNGVLRMTRMVSAPPETSPEMLAATLALDIEAARAYLARFGLHDSTPLMGVVICHGTHHAALHAAALDLSVLRLFSAEQAAAALRLPKAESVEALLIHWLRRPLFFPKLLQTAREKNCSYHFLAHDIGRAAASLALTLCLALGMGWGATLHTSQSHLEAAHQTAQKVAQALHLTRDKDSSLSQPLGRLRLAATHQRLFMTPPSFSSAVWDGLAQALDSDTRLNAFDWQASTPQRPETLTLDVRALISHEKDPLLAPPPLDASDLDRIPSVSLAPAIAAPQDDVQTIFTSLQTRLDKALPAYHRQRAVFPTGADLGALSSRPTQTEPMDAHFIYEKIRPKGTP